MFHFCSYWGRWSRELGRTKNGGIVEVNLIPIPSCYDSTWEGDVAPIRVRVHGTSPMARDKHTDELPPEILQKMRDNLDPVTMHVLLHGDIMNVIDFEKYHRVCNGGANLNQILKD